MTPKLFWVGQPPHDADGAAYDLAAFLGDWTVSVVPNYEALCDKLEWEQCDIIVSDQLQTDALEVYWIETLRQDVRWSHLPLIVLASRGESEFVRSALLAGANSVISKPTDESELLAQLTSLLRLKRAQDALAHKNSELEREVHDRTRQLEESRLEVVWRLSKAAETRDVETGNHTLRVGYYAQATAQALGQSKEYQEKLLLAAPLHDIGKLGIPDLILQKPGPLTREEFAIMKTHTTIGYEILMASYTPPKSYNLELGSKLVGRSPFIDMAATIALQHHEKVNGAGYPRGMTGDAIDLAARIVAVADAYDAIRSERPYKAAVPEHEAIILLQKSVHEHFDGDVVLAFLDSLPAIRAIGKDLADGDAFQRAAA